MSDPITVDIFLTVLCPIAIFVFWVIGVFFLVYYQHPDDTANSRLPKLIIVLSICLVFCNVFMLPLDVGSRNSRYGGLPMFYLWYANYALMAVVGMLLIPFAFFWYEAEDPLKPNKSIWKWVVLKVVVFLFIFFAISFLLWIFLGVAQISTNILVATVIPGDDPASTVDCSNSVVGVCSGAEITSVELNWKLNFMVFLIAMMAWLGFILFVVFAGIGLIALPFDFIYGFFHRPIPISDAEYTHNKAILGERVEKLIKQGLEYTNSGSRKYNKRELIIKWKKDVYILDGDFMRNEKTYKLKGGPRLLAWLKLGLGILCLAWSISWIIQIVSWTQLSVIDNQPGAVGYPMWNYAMAAMDGVWIFFGVFFFFLFAFYMELCVIKGNFKFGIRVPFLFQLHPMKQNYTLVSSFLFNCELLLVTSYAVVEFSAQSFSVYARDTSAQGIFAVAIYNLRGLKWVWFAFGWILLGFSFLTLIYFLFRPSDKGKNGRAVLSEVDY